MKQIPQHTLDFIDSWLDLTMKWEDVPGLAVAILHGGECVFEKSYGVANIETGEVLTPQHQFRFASHSKMFTATAILQLKENEKLRLDDTVQTHLKWLIDHKDARWRDVTIRQLLSHSTGMIRDGNGEDFWSLRSEFPDINKLKQWVLKESLILEPNTKLKYSNIGYGLLGLIVEQASGKAYEQYVADKIITPLKLQYTSVDLSNRYKNVSGHSRKTLQKKVFVLPNSKANALAPATGFSSTPREMARFVDALKIGSGFLLNDTSKREMQHVEWKFLSDSDYGLGVDLSKEKFGHSGGYPGFRSRTWHDKDNDITVSAVTNGAAPISAIANSIFATINEFGDESPIDEHMKFEQRFTGLNECIEIIAHAGGLRKIIPIGWWPMDSIVKLSLLKGTEDILRIDECGSSEDEGELIEYTFDKNKVIQAKESEQLLIPTIDGDLKPWW